MEFPSTKITTLCLSDQEVAEPLGVMERTVQRDWAKARLFLSAVPGQRARP
jgi:hypothetical protein